jgi:hypothetical protein
MPNTPGHKGSTNQNDIEISPHSSQNGYQEQTTHAGDNGEVEGTLICY